MVKKTKNQKAEPVEIKKSKVSKEAKQDSFVKKKKDFVKSSNEALARAFINKRESLRVDPTKPERVLSEKKKAAVEILHSRTKLEPMTVRVTGIEPIKNPEGGFTMMPVSMYHGIKIIIPRSEFLKDDMISNPDEEGWERRVNGSLGAEISIIPVKFVPIVDKNTGREEKVVIASRLKAMNILRERYWNATNTKGKKTEFAIKEGDVIPDARVVYVVKGGVTVELFGIESFVPVIDTSYARIENCRAKFKSGDRIPVKIKEVDRESGSFICSIKEGTPDKRLERMNMTVIGGVYLGKISWLDSELRDNAQGGLYVTLESGLEVRCNFPKGILPELGDRVRVVIRKKDYDELKTWGDVVHVDLQGDAIEKKKI